MPKYLIVVEYSEMSLYRSTVEIEAATEAEAIAQARREDEGGHMRFESCTGDCSDTSYTVERVTVTDEALALDAMTSEYLGEARS